IILLSFASHCAPFPRRHQWAALPARPLRLLAHVLRGRPARLLPPGAAGNPGIPEIPGMWGLWGLWGVPAGPALHPALRAPAGPGRAPPAPPPSAVPGRALAAAQRPRPQEAAAPAAPGGISRVHPRHSLQQLPVQPAELPLPPSRPQAGECSGIPGPAPLRGPPEEPPHDVPIFSAP
ncbi:atherin-like, partial [Camarhynchus parvulus]|uniref:atherin-like n=1 Tax=Geospiza parvula TaxID=87175 RepID=UPI001237FA57